MPARIHQIHCADLAGPSIEKRSLQMIQDLVPQQGLSEGAWRVVCRLVHTCGDPHIAHEISFQNHAVQAGVDALRCGAPIYVDSNMQRAGLSLSRLSQVHSLYQASSIHCHVADADVAESARQHQKARSLFAIRKAAPFLSGAIVAIGNAPVALLELNRMILEEGLRPALVIGMPVGFVHVEESKQELQQLDVPSVIIRGRRGGSALAVATIHALAIQAIAGEKDE